MTSSSRRKPQTTVWSAAPGIEPRLRQAVAAAVAAGFVLVASAAVVGAGSSARADNLSAVGPEAAVPIGESVPPAGVILGGAVAGVGSGQPRGSAVAPMPPEPAAFPAPLPAPEPDDSISIASPSEPERVAIRLVAADQAATDTAADKTQSQDALDKESESQRKRDERDQRDQRDQDERREKNRQKDKETAQNACTDQSKDCREALQELRNDKLATIGLDIRVGGRPGSDYPCECRLEGETFQPRRFATTTFTWKAAGYCHKPLYFEDWNLERYGHSHGCLDPVISAAHFFVTLPVLPYKMGVELPWECVYPLGYYRPGNCAPWTVPAVPISARGFAVEAATITGLVFLLP